MTKILAVLIVASLMAFPAHAGMIRVPDPIEQELIKKPAQSESQRMTQEYQRDADQPAKPPQTERPTGSNWWKWALGVIVIGGVAAAAGGGHGGGGSSSNGSGTVVIGW